MYVYKCKRYYVLLQLHIHMEKIMDSDKNTEAVQEILRKAAPRWFDGFALGIFAGNVKHECIYIYIMQLLNFT